MVQARLGPVHLATVDPRAPVRAGLGLEAPTGGDGVGYGAATFPAARHASDGWGLHFLILPPRDRATYGRRAMILAGRPRRPSSCARDSRAAG